MIIEGYNWFGSTEKLSGALKNILDYYGVVVPHTGEPFTEAMLMGIGGGLGLEYLTFTLKSKYFPPEKRGRTSFFLRFWPTSRDFLKTMASRIGATLFVHQTSSRAKGYRTLVDALNKGKPVIIGLSIASREADKEFFHYLPYYTLPYTWVGNYAHCVIVYGINEEAGRAHVADWSSQPLLLTLEELAEARAAVPGRKHAATVIEPPKEVRNLENAIRAGIRDCCQELKKPSAASALFGVQTLEKWANRIANPRDKKGWQQLFSGHERLFDVLTQVHGLVEFFNSSGGALRAAYADFLEEASDIIGKAKLRNVSMLYRDLAGKWTDFAKAVLPDSVPLFKNARLAAVKWNEIFLTKGQSSPRELEKAVEKVRYIRRQVSESFPLTEMEVLDLLENMSKHLLGLYKDETKALAALKSIV
ncbi:MAG: DUF4872 domain-containing protein [Candidatus Hodarchaeota archaeon]